MTSLPPSYFEDMYVRSPDPWGFRTRWYEQRKRSVVLASLLQERYETGFEPGCSNGVLTTGLAGRVDRLTAMDVSSVALAEAASTLPETVMLRSGQVPDAWPDGSFDLVVVSELAYYLGRSECAVLAAKATASARELVVVHWRHPVSDYPLGGDEAQEIFARAAGQGGFERMVCHSEADFLLDIWSRDRRSVAARGGLA